MNALDKNNPTYLPQTSHKPKNLQINLTPSKLNLVLLLIILA